MAMKPAVKYTLIGVLVIILIIITIVLIKAAKPTPVVTVKGQPPKPNIGASLITNILNNLGHSGFWSNLLGGGSGSQCDPNTPGYTKDGTRDTNCDYVNYDPYVSTCDPNMCNPDNPGYDMCGNFKMGC